MAYSYLQNVRPFSKMLVLLLRIRMFTVRAPHSTVPWGTRATAEATSELLGNMAIFWWGLQPLWCRLLLV